MAIIDNLQNFGLRAENMGAYTVDSEVQGIMFIAKDDEFGIATRDGFIRFKRKDIETILDEILQIEEDLKFRDRCDVELMEVSKAKGRQRIDEKRITLLFKSGWRNTEIADELGICTGTVCKWKRKLTKEGKI